MHLTKLSLLFCFGLLNVATSAVYADSDISKIMMLGTFHFDNPELDLVNSSSTDVMLPENQKYLTSLSEHIAHEYRPTKVLVECTSEQQQELDRQYAQFVQGKFSLPRNETYQLGFRISKLAGLSGVICYDDKSTAWDAENLFNELKQNGVRQQEFESLIAKLEQHLAQIHKKGMADILIAYNSEEMDLLNKSFYLSINDIGAYSSFSGANSSATWWQRNFKMYANIQYYSKPAEKVFVIGGQGHIAILRDFLQMDQHRNEIDIKPLLK